MFGLGPEWELSLSTDATTVRESARARSGAARMFARRLDHLLITGR
jgi:hypothetical protein